MIKTDFHIKDLADLSKIAAWVNERVISNTLILLEGPLGVGKTAFVKLLAEKQHFTANKVKSPTFSIINRYETKNYRMAHIDLYRLEKHDQFILEEMLEILAEKESLMCIEWPEKINLKSLFGRARQIIEIKLEFESKDFRKASICVKKS